MPDVRSSITDAVQFYGSSTPRELVREYGSPLYVYNETILRTRCRELLGLSSHPGFRVNYSAKANTNPALLRIIREEGCVADAMSPGELYLNKMAGFTPDQLLYVCNNVPAEELAAAVDAGLIVSVDSLAQLDLLGRTRPGCRAMVRLNPGIGAGHHQKVITAGKKTKFGISPASLPEVFDIVNAHKMRLSGLNQHIGSLFMEPEGYLNAMDVLLGIASRLRSEGRLNDLEILDFGGGFGIPYHKYENQPRLDLTALGQGIHQRISEWSAQNNYKGRFYVEPGRYISAECCVLLGTVTATKSNAETAYAGSDLGFNVLMRPVLYDAFHDIEIYRGTAPESETVAQTIVGNICESGDILAHNRELPRLKENDILGVLDAGAYGYVMASTYNSRPRPAEVLITKNGTPKLIRRRETLEDLAALFTD